MQRKFIFRAGLSLLAAASLLAAGCSSAEAPAPAAQPSPAPSESAAPVEVDPFAERLSMTFLTPFGYILAYSPVMNAAAGGHFDTYGLDVSFEAARGSAAAITQVISGQADVARSDAIDVLEAVARGADVVAFASITQRPPFYVISSPSAPVNTPEEMVGKTIGIISVGGATDKLLQLMLSDAGIDSSTVNIEVVGTGAGSFGLIEQGRIDAFIDTSSSVVRLRSAGVGIRSWNVSDVVRVPSQVYVTRREVLETQPELVDRFLLAIRASMDDIYAADSLLTVTNRMSRIFEISDIDLSNPDIGADALAADSRLWIAEGRENLLRNLPEVWESGANALVASGIVTSVEATDAYTTEVYDRVFGR
jgi:ABC-type nitrate/sulfonate/bicarbonate transport system substrate-binding protein